MSLVDRVLLRVTRSLPEVEVQDEPLKQIIQAGDSLQKALEARSTCHYHCFADRSPAAIQRCHHCGEAIENARRSYEHAAEVVRDSQRQSPHLDSLSEELC
jgi:hypothetical protein